MPKLQAKRLVYLLNCLSNKLDAGAELEFPLKKIWSCGSNAWFRAYGFFNVKSWAIVNQKSKHKTVARRWRYSISNNSRSVETSQQLQKIRLKMHLNEATSTVRMRGDYRLFHSTISYLGDILARDCSSSWFVESKHQSTNTTRFCGVVTIFDSGSSDRERMPAENLGIEWWVA